MKFTNCAICAVCLESHGEGVVKDTRCEGFVPIEGPLGVCRYVKQMNIFDTQYEECCHPEVVAFECGKIMNMGKEKTEEDAYKAAHHALTGE